MYKERHMKFIEGGICAATGFTASGVHCGGESIKNLFSVVYAAGNSEVTR